MGLPLILNCFPLTSYHGVVVIRPQSLLRCTNFIENAGLLDYSPDK